MKTLEWRSEFEFGVEGVNFQCAVGDYSGRTDRDRFILLKDRAVLEQYEQVFAEEQPRNVLEFGIFQGGSPTLFSLWFGVERFVGLDICGPVVAFDEFRRIHPVGERIRCHYRVSQTDRERIEHIVKTEFGTTPLDLIIDDASHEYEKSRATFEIAFPLLRPGGTYVLEDWGWAHWQQEQTHFRGQTPLSALVMELLMLCASRSDLISEVRVFSAFAFIRKSTAAPVLPNFRLEGLYHTRGLEFVGSQHLNLHGVARVVASSAKERAARRVRRTKAKLARAFQRIVEPRRD